MTARTIVYLKDLSKIWVNAEERPIETVTDGLKNSIAICSSDIAEENELSSLNGDGEQVELPEEQDLSRLNSDDEKVTYDNDLNSDRVEIDDEDIEKEDELNVEWMSTDEFIEKVTDKINVMEKGKAPAISLQKYVFLQVSLIWKIVCNLAREKGLDNRFNENCSVDEIKKVNLEVVERLTNHNFIPQDVIQQGKAGSNFVLKFKDGYEAKGQYMIPIYIEAFGLGPSDLEVRKKGKLENIICIESETD